MALRMLLLAACAAGIVACGSDGDVAVSTTSAPTTVATTANDHEDSDPTTGPASTTPSITLGDSTSSSTSAAGRSGVLEHPTGFSLSYPAGWESTLQAVVGTPFITGAECAAALVVDQAAPTDPAAQAGFVLQSGVQVCAQPTGGTSLDAYMEEFYGDGVPGFNRAEFGGLQAYRSDVEDRTLIFVQTDAYRFQVVTFVVAESGLETDRRRQVREVLDSVRFT